MNKRHQCHVWRCIRPVVWMQMKRLDATQAAHANAQEKVGIWNRCQCSRTVSHLADMELKRERCPESSCQKVTLCVEGNISAGKSTFLKELLKSSGELRDIVEVKESHAARALNAWYAAHIAIAPIYSRAGIGSFPASISVEGSAGIALPSAEHSGH